MAGEQSANPLGRDPFAATCAIESDDRQFRQRSPGRRR